MSALRGDAIATSQHVDEVNSGVNVSRVKGCKKQTEMSFDASLAG